MDGDSRWWEGALRAFGEEMYLSMVSNSDRVSLDKVGKDNSFVGQHSRVLCLICMLAYPL